jgi:hypothetical protein
LIKDLEGNRLREINGKTAAGLQKVRWNLRKRRVQTAGGQRQFRGRRGPSTVEAGTYKATLVVDDKEIVTKKFKVIDDPILK